MSKRESLAFCLFNLIVAISFLFFLYRGADIYRHSGKTTNEKILAARDNVNGYGCDKSEEIKKIFDTMANDMSFWFRNFNSVLTYAFSSFAFVLLGNAVAFAINIKRMKNSASRCPETIKSAN